MSAETTVYAALSSAPALAARVGDRIYPDVLPEKTVYPAVVFSREGTEPIYSLSNHYFGADIRLQVGCWGKGRAEVDAVADAVSAALAGAGILPQGRNAGYDPETDLYAAVVDVEIFESP